jgi:hypothetical protein
MRITITITAKKIIAISGTDSECNSNAHAVWQRAKYNREKSESGPVPASFQRPIPGETHGEANFGKVMPFAYSYAGLSRG